MPCRGHQGSNCLEMPYGHQIWWKESLTKVLYIAGVKGHEGVSWGQVGVNVLSSAHWPPNLVGRTPDQSAMYCWGQRSCRGQPGSTRGQIPQKCPVATKFGSKDPRPECNAMRSCRGQLGSTQGKIA